MTPEEKKRFLNRYGCIERSIEDHTEELYRWRSRAVKITPGLPGVPRSQGSRGTSNVCLAVEKIDEIERLIASELSRLHTLRKIIEQVIQGVKEESLRQLLYLRYIQGCSYEEIGNRMSYSWRQIQRLHGTALERLEIPESFAQTENDGCKPASSGV